MNMLPQNHPLQYAFSSYWDARNLPGIVDGFLHASDRGFTGFELCSLIDQANLVPSFCFHRPWGQPALMAEKLPQLGEHNFSFWLHYLDLWQSLRTNFTLCLTKKGLATSDSFSPTKHPLFNLSSSQLKFTDKARLLRLSLTGGRLPSRTDESSLNLNASEFSQLIWKNPIFQSSNFPIHLYPHQEKWDESFDVRMNELIPRSHFKLRAGSKVLNPIYDYLFDAYTFSESYNSIANNSLPDLPSQIKVWETEAYPLESHSIPWGLTPFGTYQHHSLAITDYQPHYLSAQEISFENFSLPQETKALQQVRAFLKNLPDGLNPSLELSSLRQLWFLLFSFEKLFIE